MDGSWFEPCCTRTPNCSYLLMCLRNNILHLVLSRCQAVWPGGDVLNGILIIEIFAALALPFCWLWSFRQMVSITLVQLESGEEVGGVLEGLCKNWILLCSHVPRSWDLQNLANCEKPYEQIWLSIICMTATCHFPFFQTYLTTDKWDTRRFPPCASEP